MKRFVSLDFARGVGILGVLLIHVLNASYNISWTEHLETAPIPMIILLLILTYFGGFVGMFVLLSAIGNFVSINSQLIRLREKGIDDAVARKSIMKQQAIRGALVWIIGYISEGLLNGVVLNLIQGEIDFAPLTMYLWGTQILQTIGLCTFFSCALYMLFLKWRWDRRKMSKAFLLLALGILVFRGILEILKNNGVIDLTFWNNIESREWYVNLGLLVLAPFVARIFPLVPYFAMACIGAVIGLHIYEGKFDLRFLKQLQKFAILMFLGGFLLGIVSAVIKGFSDVQAALDFLLSSSTISGFLFMNGGALLLAKMILYRVEYKQKTVKFARHTVFFRRFGMVTLTLWAFQWVMAFPLYLLQFITGWNVVNQGLNGYQLMFVLFLITLMWHVILWRWERVDFRYSFEWLMVRLMSKSKEDAGRRMKVQEVLYHPEGIVTREGPGESPATPI